MCILHSDLLRTSKKSPASECRVSRCLYHYSITTATASHTPSKHASGLSHTIYSRNLNLSAHMSVIRPFDPTDILRFNNINADPWTATVGFSYLSNMDMLTLLVKYHNGYYASYTAQWPDWCVAVEGAYDPTLKAYSKHGSFITQAHLLTLSPVISKHEPPAPDPQHHGHLTALSIAPSHRSLGLARVLMDVLEGLSGPGEIAVECNNDHGAHAHEHQAVPTGAARDSVDAWFVDLFVRCNNVRAISMYEKMGYSVYRRVVE